MIRLALRNPHAVVVMTLAILIFGVTAASRIPSDLLPAFTAPLILHGIPPSLRQIHSLSATEPVTFRQLSANAQTYRDAVEFKSGLKLRVQDLEEGQSVEVLALSSEKFDIQQDTFAVLEEVGRL